MAAERDVALAEPQFLAGGDAEQNQMSVFMALASANSARVVQDFVTRLPD